MRNLILLLLAERIIIYLEDRYQADYDELSYDVKQQDHEPL